jgi:dTMP kinase
VKGRFITVEGQDGAGKSTNLAVIAEFLRGRSIEFVQTREPGGTETAERIRELLLNSNDNDFGDLTELLLVFAARADHLQHKIVPALESGVWVLCDRFTDATFAYQGGGRQMDMHTIERLQALVQAELRPDLTVLLDLPVEIGEQRAKARSSADRFELQQAQFKQRVRDSYLAIAEAEPDRVKVIDASTDLSAVKHQILDVLEAFVDD